MKQKTHKESQLQLDVEATALSQEKLAKIREELKPLKLRHKAEKERVDELRKLKQKLKNLQVKMAQAEREKKLALVADMKYGATPDLGKKLKQNIELPKKINNNKIVY
jgi:ATP-dependent Clp protease ATP-binding subunit ClpB